MAIKRGVSLYSYQQTYYKGEFDLEGCVKAASMAGAEGIELIPEQMMIGTYPNPTDAEVAQWFDLMETYHTRPTCLDAFMDTRMYKNRFLTLKEQVQLMERDLKLASKLGFSSIRVLCHVRPEVIEASLPIAQHYNIKMGLEVHAPFKLDGEWINNLVEMIERKNTPYAGLIPDFGIFGRGPDGAQYRLAKLKGADESILKEISDTCKNNGDVLALERDLIKREVGPLELKLAKAATFVRYNNPELLRRFEKHLIHFHAKFYEMNEDYKETSIDYENPIRILKDMGWDGYLSSEFEGQRPYQVQDCSYEADEVEQVRRHHIMMKRLIEG